MTTSSEDVLLSVSYVRYKKGDGTLYVMNQRLAWMLENRDTVAVSHKYADIKAQKISPAGKSKVQLQVVLHDGTCSTFHFVNPAGPKAQAKERDQVKSLLQMLLPKFKRQIDGELEMKSRILSLHPTLKHLYEDLVISKVINSEEYWNTPTLKNYTENTNTNQEAGVSGAFLADIQPQTDGCNGLKYNLTQDVIDAIFKTYPAVRKKHIDYVPNKMTEAEFWTKFFQSHYFHRDRIASSSSKDLFGECAKMDDHAISSAMKHTTLDMTVDLPQFSEPVPLLPAEEEPPQEKERGDNTSIHRNMIKRFNQHSIMVLKASHKTNCNNNNNNSNSNKNSNHNNNKIVENGRIKETNGVAEKRHKTAEETCDGEQPEKKKRILEKIHYEDLENSNKSEEAQELKLSKIERYLLGPSSQINQMNAITNSSPPLSALASICQAWSNGQQCQRPVRLSAAAAVGALGELSPGGALMRQHHAASMAQLIPADVKAELHRIYLSGGELLRELWRCFPQPGSAADTEDTVVRAEKFYEALLRFRNVKLRPFEEKMLRDLTPLATSLTKHMNQMIDTACSKYVVWQQRQAKLR
ncbi:general transcription factor IIH subunit 1 [Pectinophora gossypiella]|uniref:general transcription factor IIH subunit 1 n=1 Tax=Pectinophora gossypiella TaxID=13191 RepID=UPI00214EA20E|nr:general transcription factor IIH subunit 1 [Pectinophora gossypiella]XP_049886021.1 general transcription factor IIH subunit 1 [Pectinophora gossypiella]XP_049886022.1 general transcription factor IIH subunit 1 [Pectinophora gossypiella]